MSWLLGDCCGSGGHLVWTTPTPLVVLAVGGAVTILLFAAWPLPRTLRRVAELGLLVAALVALVWMAAGPSWLQEGERLEAGRQVVLVDASRSMQVLDADGRPRAAQVEAVLARNPEAEVYSFGSRLRPGRPDVYDDGDSDLGGALDAISRRYAGERLRSVIVVTDGLDRGGLRQRLSADAEAPLPTLGGPLTLYQVGQVGARTDLAVTDIHAGGFAFLRAPLKLDVDVRAVGLARRSMPVSLTREGQPVATVTATLDGDGRGTAHFELTPDKVGRFLFEASVPLVEGDAVPANNTLDLAVRVVRDRMRVLQVCGSPSWDEKTMRLFLKEDPSVDLVSFFILRTERDMGAGYDGSELSLISFPYQRLFSRDLPTFDLVILQNFDYAPYFDYDANELLGNIAQYVRDGGALVMLGGDRSFDLGKYAGTPLAEVLPVRLGVTGKPVDEAPFTPVLTASGARHPVPRLEGDVAENAAAWARLGPLDGLNLTRGAAEGAAVLLQHPTLTTEDGQPLPVLTVGSYGAGRSMALMSDSSWRWSFGEAAVGRGNEAYLRFWKNAMRWLVGDPEDRPVVIEGGRENFQPGEVGRVDVQVRDVSFAPVVDARVHAEVSGPGGRVPIDATTGADGRATLILPTTERGPHRVKVRATSTSGAALGEAEAVYAVTSRDPELDEVEPDVGFLTTLAARVGGRYVPPGGTDTALEDPEAGRRVRDRKETPLGTVPLVPLVVGLAVSGSWILRRRGGLR